MAQAGPVSNLVKVHIQAHLVWLVLQRLCPEELQPGRELPDAKDDLQHLHEITLL